MAEYILNYTPIIGAIELYRDALVPHIIDQPKINKKYA